MTCRFHLQDLRRHWEFLRIRRRTRARSRFGSLLGASGPQRLPPMETDHDHHRRSREQRPALPKPQKSSQAVIEQSSGQVWRKIECACSQMCSRQRSKWRTMREINTSPSRTDRSCKSSMTDLFQIAWTRSQWSSFFVNGIIQQLHKVRYIENRDGVLFLEH